MFIMVVLMVDMAVMTMTFTVMLIMVPSWAVVVFVTLFLMEV